MKTALVVFVAATLVGFAFDVDTLSDSTRPSTEPLAELLLERGYDTVVADYWIAYQMTFESNEEVLATPNVAIRDHRTALDVAASRPAFVFRESTPPAEYVWVVSNLDAMRIPYDIVHAGDYLAILPARTVGPALDHRVLARRATIATATPLRARSYRGRPGWRGSLPLPGSTAMRPSRRYRIPRWRTIVSLRRRPL